MTKKAQGTIEFALILPLLLLFVVGIADMSRLFHSWVQLNHAVGQAARYAVTMEYNPSHCVAPCDDVTYYEPARQESIRDVFFGATAGLVQEELRVLLCAPYPTAHVEDDDLGFCNPTEYAGIPGDKVIVRGTYEFDFIFPFMSVLGSLDMRESRVMVIEPGYAQGWYHPSAQVVVMIEPETLTPSPVPSSTPTILPSPTVTVTPMPSSTSTPSLTPTATVLPNCSLFGILGVDSKGMFGPTVYRVEFSPPGNGSNLLNTERVLFTWSGDTTGQFLDFIFEGSQSGTHSDTDDTPWDGTAFSPASIDESYQSLGAGAGNWRFDAVFGGTAYGTFRFQFLMSFKSVPEDTCMFDTGFFTVTAPTVTPAPTLTPSPTLPPSPTAVPTNHPDCGVSVFEIGQHSFEPEWFRITLTNQTAVTWFIGSATVGWSGSVEAIAFAFGNFTYWIGSDSTNPAGPYPDPPGTITGILALKNKSHRFLFQDPIPPGTLFNYSILLWREDNPAAPCVIEGIYIGP